MTQRRLSKMLLPSSKVFTDPEVRKWIDNLLMALDERTIALDRANRSVQTDIATNAADIDTNADDIDTLEASAGTIGLFSNVEHHTSDDTLLASESGSCHTNIGSSSDVTLTLPDNAAKGTFFFFFFGNTSEGADELFIYPSGNNGIYWSGFVNTPGPDGYWIKSSQRGFAIGLVADADGDWVPLSVNGAWGNQSDV